MVAMEFLYILYLETFATASKATSKVFRLGKKELSNPNINTLLKNQGVYNGLISAGLIYTAFFSSAPLEFSRLILIYIICVALYGAFSSNPKIILTQGGLAILALISTLF